MTTIAAPSRWSYEAGWLSGPVYDKIFIFGVMSVALLSGAVVLWRPDLFLYVMLADLWFLGYHHVIATFTKLAGTKEDREANRFLILHLPLIVVAVVTAMWVGIGIWPIITVYFFWQWFHYARQSYGIATFYRKKSNFPAQENPRLFLATLWSFPIWGILNRCHQGWDEFLGQPIWMPEVPEWTVVIAGTVSVFLFAAWVIERFVAWYQGRLSIAYTLYMLSHFIIFATGYALIRDINTGWLVANIWHNAQYILFVWLFNNNRFKKSSEGSIKWLSWSSQPKPLHILVYFAICLGITTIFYGSLSKILQWVAEGDQMFVTALYVVAFQTVNFHHYVADSLIWKARKKSHQQIMELKP